MMRSRIWLRSCTSRRVCLSWAGATTTPHAWRELWSVTCLSRTVSLLLSVSLCLFSGGDLGFSNLCFSLCFSPNLCLKLCYCLFPSPPLSRSTSLSPPPPLSRSLSLSPPLSPPPLSLSVPLSLFQNVSRNQLIALYHTLLYLCS